MTQFWLASAVGTGLPYRGNPVVGEVAYEDGGEWAVSLQQCHIQTRPGPLSLLEEQSVTPIVLLFFFVLSATPQTGWNDQGM